MQDRLQVRPINNLGVQISEHSQHLSGDQHYHHYHSSKMSGSESNMKKATEAMKRENARLEEENRKKDKEMADLLKEIKNVKSH